MSFKDIEKTRQINWWMTYSLQPNWESEPMKWGKHTNGVSYAHIIKDNWKKNLLWAGIQDELPDYLVEKKINPHSGVHDLLSSWVVAANLYFPTRSIKSLKTLLLGFLQSRVSPDIIDVENVELEYALDGDLSPKKLLGEMDGGRGVGQTSPDIAFIVKTKQGKGLILIECKYTEHSFYGCSARCKKDKGKRKGNPYPEKCLQAAAMCNYETLPCHQKVWGRKYLDHFKLSDEGKKVLTRCPAATAGYQLLRQQALANGIMESGKYDLVVSSVSFDKRNSTLKGCLKSTGIPDFPTGWSEIYLHGSKFIPWHHQDWVQYVRTNQENDEFDNWLEYLNSRYGY